MSVSKASHAFAATAKGRLRLADEKEVVMRSVPTAKSVLITGSRAGKKLASHGIAETWVRQAIAAGCDPFMQQEPLFSDGSAGEWLLVLSTAGRNSPLHPGKLPNGLFDEVFLILARSGRVTHDEYLRPWHGDVLLDDSSSRAIAFRITLVRESLSRNTALFYEACGIPAKVGEAIEGGQLSFLSPDQEMLQAIWRHYDIPEEWLIHGPAEEIEA